MHIKEEAEDPVALMEKVLLSDQHTFLTNLAELQEVIPGHLGQFLRAERGYLEHFLD